MKQCNAIQKIIPQHKYFVPKILYGSAFAPANIALCKYWGKRDVELNLPFADSLSISLGNKGASTTISYVEGEDDIIVFNNEVVSPASQFSKRILQFIDTVRPRPDLRFLIQTHSNIPVAAGLASSASGFASLVLACNQLFDWNLSEHELSQLARMCSGSASRSIFPKGFVKWHAGRAEDGSDSYAEVLPQVWPELCVGILLISEKQKPIGSREAMRRTVETSPDYEDWVAEQPKAIAALEQAIAEKNFQQLGEVAERNACGMHATMHSATPSINYNLPETTRFVEQVRQLRDAGLSVYFTQDAGPNLKLLFLKKDLKQIRQHFPDIQIIEPFGESEPFSSLETDLRQVRPYVDQVVVVDEYDHQVGVMEKQRAHQVGFRHRAFSFFLVRKVGDGFEVLLQQRHPEKYHCGGLWANTCCSHPRLGESLNEAVKRRVFEELGLELSDVDEVGSFHYIAEFENGLTENEMDHVFMGYDDGGELKPNKTEIASLRWVGVRSLRKEMEEDGAPFVPWLSPALQLLEAWLQ